MKNYEFLKLAEEVRKKCDELSERQLKELISLLTYDLETRKPDEES